ncbi:DMT family transporter [Paenibacillus sp. UNC499MF]|uniref:DMT family transporter n=1 Tax=Paenibacillus sp. UNC499MF TaxID=1502751 RepID=UPI00089FE15B|nr:DMT family transporter [Paenibacillus sp. UNC499MF]SEG67036.1 EamA-like transporter family protein [Paenibacillus sp. UNC499MF]
MWFMYASLAAVSFGLRGILYQWTSQRRTDRNVLLFGVYLSGALISFVVNLFVNQTWSQGVWFGVPMGLFSFIANASMYKGYSVGRASLIALFTGLPPVVVVTLAYFMWGEALGLVQMAGFCIVILGLLVIRYSHDLKLGQLQGIQWGLLTMLFFGFTDLSSKQATLSAANTLPVLTVMYGTGTILFACMYLLSRLKTPAEKGLKITAAGTAHETPRERETGEGPYGQQARISRHSGESGSSPNSGESRQPLQNSGGPVRAASPVWSMKRTVLWGMTVGITNLAGMLFIIPAFRGGVTGIVSAISAMNVVLVLLYAQFYLKENISRREACGMLLALAGILVVRLAS